MERARTLSWIALLILVGSAMQPLSALTLCLLGSLALSDFVLRKPALSGSPKLILCYLLIGYTNGLSSEAYYALLGLVLLTAQNTSFRFAMIFSSLAAALYLSFALFAIPQDWSLASVVLGAAFLAMTSCLTLGETRSRYSNA